MTDIVMLIFTGVISLSTLLYTIYSRRLWKETQRSVDIARYTGFFNLMILLSNRIEDAKKQGLPEAELLDQIGGFLAEFSFTKFLEELDLSKDKDAHQYFCNIEKIMRANNMDPNKISWFKPILNKLGK